MEKKLIDLKKFGETNGFEQVIVVIPLYEQMISKSFANAAYQTELLRIGSQNDISVVDPLPAIQAHKPFYPDWFIPFVGYPNGRIYEIIANELKNFIALNIEGADLSK